MDRLGKLGVVTLATVLMWVGMFVVRVLADNSFITGMAVLIAFGCTVALWMVLGLEAIGQKTPDKAAHAEKAKRGASEDARLALLLQMLDDDERQALKQRLMDQVGGDGEVVSLADLLAEEQRFERRA